MKKYQSRILGMVLPVALNAGVCLYMKAFGAQPSFPLTVGSRFGLISIIVILLIQG